MSRIGPFVLVFLTAVSAACQTDPRLPNSSRQGEEDSPASVRVLALWPPDTANQIGPELIASAPELQSMLPACSKITPVITSDSVGPFRVGVTVSDILRGCGEIYRGWDWGYEGVPEPVMAVRLGEAVVIAPRS